MAQNEHSDSGTTGTNAAMRIPTAASEPASSAVKEVADAGRDSSAINAGGDATVEISNDGLAKGGPDGSGGNASSGRKRSSDEEGKIGDDEGPLPTLPLKRARTAYFIFADEKREEVKQKHQGEGVAAIAKVIGQMWSALQPSQKEVYEKQSAKERERVSRDMQRLKDAGLWPDSGGADAAGAGAGGDDDALVYPIGRIRKICKLDPEVKGMSKESALLITRATELFTTKLGRECVIMAQMQNRRKLLPEDVVEVCSMKERFMFLKPDLIDLRKAQLEEMNMKEKENGKDSKGGSSGMKEGEDGGAGKTLDSYFGKVRNS